MFCQESGAYWQPSVRLGTCEVAVGFRKVTDLCFNSCVFCYAPPAGRAPIVRIGCRSLTLPGSCDGEREHRATEPLSRGGRGEGALLHIYIKSLSGNQRKRPQPLLWVVIWCERASLWSSAAGCAAPHPSPGLLIRDGNTGRLAGARHRSQ